MAAIEHAEGNPTRDGVSRRDFLRVGGIGVISLSAAERARRSALARQRVGDRRCLLIMLNGGVSQLDTFDPKPHATLDIRGPFRPISTAVPSLAISEVFPRLAALANDWSLIRALHSSAAPLHETGLQLAQAGRLQTLRQSYPTLGEMISQHVGGSVEHPVYAVLPQVPVMVRKRPLSAFATDGSSDYAAHRQPTGPNGMHVEGVTDAALKQTASEDHSPWYLAHADATERATVEQWRTRESDQTRQLYGDTEFGRNCLLARQLLEQDFRFVTVHSAPKWIGTTSWDCHASGPIAPTTVAETAPLARQCDRVLAGLLEDLKQRGLLKDTLVVVTSEFGRTPRINRAGGRDHWMGVWSALMAGGQTAGGTVVGASDSRGAEPLDQPCTPADVAATMLSHFGIDGNQVGLA